MNMIRHIGLDLNGFNQLHGHTIEISNLIYLCMRHSTTLTHRHRAIVIEHIIYWGVPI